VVAQLIKDRAVPQDRAERVIAEFAVTDRAAAQAKGLAHSTGPPPSTTATPTL
jgi:hypothetical protein